SYYPNNSTPSEPAKDEPRPVTATTPIWRNIRISNVVATDCDEAGRIFGLPEMPVQNVVFKNVKISALTGFQIANAKQIEFQASTIDAKSGKDLMAANGDVSGITANQ